MLFSPISCDKRASVAHLRAMAQDVEIRYYEDWMRLQVLAMFREEYGADEKSFERFFNHLYEHPFQKEKCIRLAAVEGEKVAGFQSFFYWPYTFNGKMLYTLQSGNTLVHKDFRGKGLFQKLINYVFENDNSVKADFMMGFPVVASFKGFIKNKWLNVLNLKWYVRIMNPVAIAFPIGLNKRFVHKFQPSQNTAEKFKLSESKEFVDWKEGLKNTNHKYYFYTAEVNDGKKITFELRTQVRKKVIKELIIGKVFFEQGTEQYLEIGIKKLLRDVRKSLSVTMISIAINEDCKLPDYAESVKKCGFKKIENEIHFIVRPVRKDSEQETTAALWDIGRADIDTW